MICVDINEYVKIEDTSENVRSRDTHEKRDKGLPKIGSSVLMFCLPGTWGQDALSS